MIYQQQYNQDNIGRTDLSKHEIIDQAFDNVDKYGVYLSWLELTAQDSQYINHKDSSMTAIYLNNNSLLDIGCLYFQRSQWQALQQLHLGGNLISNRGCKYLSKAAYPLLQLLYIDRNQIQTTGIMHLFKNQWKKLRSINLFQNRIDSNGVIFICRFFCRLIALDLWCNQILITGLRKLYYIQNPESLRVLKIKQIGLSMHQRAIQQPIIRNKFSQLHILRMDD